MLEEKKREGTEKLRQQKKDKKMVQKTGLRFFLNRGGQQKEQEMEEKGTM